VRVSAYRHGTATQAATDGTAVAAAAAAGELRRARVSAATPPPGGAGAEQQDDGRHARHALRTPHPRAPQGTTFHLLPFVPVMSG